MGPSSRSLVFRSSSGPKNTPKPALAPSLPLLREAPSQYTTCGPSIAVALVGTPGAGAGAGTGSSMPATKASAAARDVNFLYRAFWWPTTCALQSSLFSCSRVRWLCSPHHNHPPISLPRQEHATLAPCPDGVEQRRGRFAHPRRLKNWQI